MDKAFAEAQYDEFNAVRIAQTDLLGSDFDHAMKELRKAHQRLREVKNEP